MDAEKREFTYTVKNLKGEAREGRVLAVSDAEAARLAAGRGEYVTRLEARGEAVRLERILQRGTPRAKLALSCRQLAVMTSAGLPLLEALRALCAQTHEARLRRAWEAVRQAVAAGESFAAALAAQPKAFPRGMAALVAAGEAGGVLEEALERLASQLERDARLRAKLRTACVYPAFVLALAAVVVAVVLGGVLPVFASVYESAGVALPGATRWLLAFGDWCGKYGLSFCGAAAIAAFCAARFLRGGARRVQMERLLLWLPLWGTLLAKTAVARFCRTLGVLLSSGVPLLDAVAVAKQALGNAYLSARMDGVEAGLRRGEALAPLLSRLSPFAPLAARMVAVGETAGKLDFVLPKIAAYYEQETEETTARLERLLEPALLVAVGAGVAFIALALVLPMFDAMLYRVGA